MPVTTGGNSTVSNGNEQDALDTVVQVPVRTAGAQEGEFH